MRRLIAIAQPPGPGFVRALSEAWADGDAVLPVDPRLPLPSARRLVAAMAPAVLIDETGSQTRLSGSRPVEDGDALVVPTSGTTGEPKGAVLTRAAVEASARATSARLAVDPSDDAWLLRLPVAHVGGLSVVTRALLTGTPLLFDEDERPATLVSLVPTQANRDALDRYRVVLVGGGADWRSRPDNVVRTYGMTETGSGVVYDGRPLDGVEVRVDATGQIRVRGPMLLRCYRDGTSPLDAGGWLGTGDAGSIDADGVLHVEGRIGDVIVTGGEKVWPVAVEEALGAHPDVAEVAVAGRPDDEWGQRVVAWIVPAAGAVPVTLAELRDHTKSRLPAYAAPREVVVVDRLPKTPSGKVQRHLLAGHRSD